MQPKSVAQSVSPIVCEYVCLSGYSTDAIQLTVLSSYGLTGQTF